MASKEEILDEFKALNINPDEKSLNKCVQLCESYNLTAEEIVDQWSAYSLTNLKGEGPTVEHLEKMERKEFGIVLKKTIPIDQPQGNLLGTPKRYHAPGEKIRTPIQPKKRAAFDDGFSSPGNQTGNYASRTDARSVRVVYGPASEFKRDKNLLITVKPAIPEQPTLQATQAYMYEILRKKSDVLDRLTDFLGHEILKKNDLVLHDELLREFSNKHVVTYGRIVSDCDKQLNSESVLLESTRSTNLGHSLRLNLSGVDMYSLFPGQIAVVHGMHLGDQIAAEGILSHADLMMPDQIPLLDEDSSLQMVIACGPFTTHDNVRLEPLNDLIEFVNEHKPHVLMLLGPFYDRDNDGIMNGELTESFDDFFNHIIDTIMESVDSNTHVIVVSSQREPHHHPVYPTMPYSVKEKRENLTLLPDPCLVDINGVVLGATTADVLFHISNYELHHNLNPESDRLSRIASHIFGQHSFYPLDPPFKDMCVDHAMLEKYAILDIKPHVMILPSNFRHFVKNVKDCLVINPERLTKGIGGGTFAHLEIKSRFTKSICDRSTCHIVKI